MDSVVTVFGWKFSAAPPLILCEIKNAADCGLF